MRKSYQKNKILLHLKSYNNLIKEYKSVLFVGDDYSEEWNREAHMRNLASYKNYPDCVQQIIKKNNIKQ